MLYRRGDIWWTKFNWGGRTYYKSTSERTKAAARNAAVQIEAEIKRTKPRQDNGLTLADLEQLDVERLENEGYGKTRIATVRNLWRNLQRHMGEYRPVSEITADGIYAYEGLRRRDSHQMGPVRGQTIRREVQSLRRACFLAEASGLIDAQPVKWHLLRRIRSNAPKASQEGKPRDAKLIDRVLENLSAKAKTAGYVPMLRLIQATGMREGEFHRCRPEHIQGDKLLIPGEGKNTRPRLVPLPKIHKQAILKWWPGFANKCFHKALKAASARAGLPPGDVLTARDLRTTYGNRVEELAGPVVAQRLMGHTTLKTTSIYLEADMERAMTAGMEVAKMAKSGDSGW